MSSDTPLRTFLRQWLYDVWMWRHDSSGYDLEADLLALAQRLGISLEELKEATDEDED